MMLLGIGERPTVAYVGIALSAGVGIAFWSAVIAAYIVAENSGIPLVRWTLWLGLVGVLAAFNAFAIVGTGRVWREADVFDTVRRWRSQPGPFLGLLAGIAVVWLFIGVVDYEVVTRTPLPQ